MKSLSIRQPWASLIVAGIKDVENRKRPTKYRGPVLIHAATRFDEEGADWIERTFPNLIMSLPNDWLSTHFGAIIGQIDLTDCVQNHPSPWAEPGLWHWVLANPKAFDTPVPYPGRLGLFDAPDPDAEHLFKPHDGTTRRVCLTQEPCDVVITRPGKWGNPYRVRAWTGIGFLPWVIYNQMGSIVAHTTTLDAATLASIDFFRRYLHANTVLRRHLSTLKGKRLGCFCKPGAPCHGDVLVKMVEAQS